jgi:hypothetical protein
MRARAISHGLHLLWEFLHRIASHQSSLFAAIQSPRLCLHYQAQKYSRGMQSTMSNTCAENELKPTETCVEPESVGAAASPRHVWALLLANVRSSRWLLWEDGKPIRWYWLSVWLALNLRRRLITTVIWSLSITSPCNGCVCSKQRRNAATGFRTHYPVRATLRIEARDEDLPLVLRQSLSVATVANVVPARAGHIWINIYTFMSNYIVSKYEDTYILTYEQEYTSMRWGHMQVELLPYLYCIMSTHK